MFSWLCQLTSIRKINNKCAGSNKQLLDEADHDIKNYPDRGQYYLPKLKADNIDQGLDNSWYYA